MVSTNRFDAIVIGSGISGGFAAKELTEKGLRVLMLDRGKMVEHGEGYTYDGKPAYEVIPGSMLLVVWAFVRIAGGDTGRTFLAVRANERAAASSGIDVRRTKLIGFAISAFIAGVAGCLIGYSRGQLSAESFTVFAGLQVLAVAYLGGIASFGGAVVAGILGPLGIVYVLLRGVFDLGEYYPLISGLALILTAILNPVGIAGATRDQVAWVRSKLSRGREPDPPARRPAPEDTRKEPSRV